MVRARVLNYIDQGGALIKEGRSEFAGGKNKSYTAIQYSLSALIHIMSWKCISKTPNAFFDLVSIVFSYQDVIYRYLN